MNHELAPATSRILVIDDNRAIHEDFRKIFDAVAQSRSALDQADAALFGESVVTDTRPMFEIDSAYQGQDGLALVQQALAIQRSYSLAFVDVRMPPGWDGVETTAQIWREDPDIQIVICTAYSDYSWSETLAKLGWSDRLVILKKPFDTVEVLQLASALTEKWRLARQSRSYLEDLERQVAERTRALVQAAERLQNSEAQYRLLFESNPHPMWVHDLETLRFLKVNGAAVGHYGYSEEQFIGMTIADLRPADDAATPEHQADPMQGPSKGFGVCRHRRRDGSVIDVELSSERITFDGRTACLVLAHDVTERLLADEQVRQARDEAQQALRIKSQFLANMSHEIRTPMNGVIGMTQILLESRLNSSQREAAETIRCSADSLLTIINDILDFSNIASGKLRLEAIDVDLRDVVQQAVAIYADSASSKGLKLTSSFSIDALPGVLGDAGRLRQVLVNLISNAVKFTEHGHVHVNTTLERQSATGVVVRFTIRDSGVGMSEEVQARLFQSFMQADSSMSRRYGGTGLGLAISKHLVGLMGGEIGVDSSPGKGSTFWFTVPVDKSSATQAVTAAAGILPTTLAAPAFAALTHPRILVAEEDLVTQKVIQHQLLLHRLSADFVGDDRQMVKALTRQAYDLVFMDCQLPVPDAHAATAEFRRQEHKGARAWIVAMSDDETGTDREKCLAAGMDDHITKPVTARAFRKALDQFDRSADAVS